MRPIERFRRAAKAIADLEYDYDLSKASPEFCAHLLIYPNLKLFSKLEKKFVQSDRAWLYEFIEFEGLNSLLLSAEKQFSAFKQSSYFGSLLIIKCLSSIKTLMNTKLGIESLISLSLKETKFTQIIAKSNQTK